MDYNKLSLAELEELDLTKIKKEDLKEIIDIVQRHEFLINMADHLDNGDYQAMEKCRNIAKKCKEFLEGC